MQLENSTSFQPTFNFHKQLQVNGFFFPINSITQEVGRSVETGQSEKLKEGIISIKEVIPTNIPRAYTYLFNYI